MKPPDNDRYRPVKGGTESSLAAADVNYQRNSRPDPAAIIDAVELVFFRGYLDLDELMVRLGYSVMIVSRTGMLHASYPGVALSVCGLVRRSSRVVYAPGEGVDCLLCRRRARGRSW